MPPKKIFLETSILIRFFTRDQEEKFQHVSRLFEHISSGEFRPYTSNVVFLEVFYVLTSTYHFIRADVIKDLHRLLTLRNLVFIEKTNTPAALDIFQNFHIKFGDCLIATQVPKHVALVTYDANFFKLKHIRVATPADILL